MNNTNSENKNWSKDRMQNWSAVRYFYAVSWWRSNTLGSGHFNEDLYRRYLKARLDIDPTLPNPLHAQA